MDSLRIEVNGHRAHYLRAGSGPPIVLLHGAASDSQDWETTMAALSPHFTLYAPDLIGFGQSDRNEEGYYLSDFSEFVAGLIEKLALQKPVLLGHSFGGRVCLEVALQHPEIVSKLVLVDSAGFGKISRCGSMILTGFWAVRKLLRISQPFPKFLSRKGEESRWDTIDNLADIRIPTLIIWKRHDPYMPLALARRAQAVMTDARLAVLPGYGHAPQGQNRDSFNSLLDYFLRSGSAA